MDRKAAVLGLGYVGLPMVVAFEKIAEQSASMKGKIAELGQDFARKSEILSWEPTDADPLFTDSKAGNGRLPYRVGTHPLVKYKLPKPERSY